MDLIRLILVSTHASLWGLTEYLSHHINTMTLFESEYKTTTSVVLKSNAR